VWLLLPVWLFCTVAGDSAEEPKGVFSTNVLRLEMLSGLKQQLRTLRLIFKSILCSGKKQTHYKPAKGQLNNSQQIN